MAKDEHPTQILISIYPRYADAIINGVKRVEFRKNGCPTSAQLIALYSTKPDSAIRALCKVDSCVVANKHTLWKRYGKVGAISYKDFMAYFYGTTIGKCYVLGKVCKLKSPLPLKRLASVRSVPQSFAYLSKEDIRLLQRKCEAPKTGAGL